MTSLGVTVVPIPTPTPDPTDNDADIVLPDVGDEAAPTSEMVAKGNVGNGTWDEFTPELAGTIQRERAESKRETALAREEAYEEGMKDALQLSGRLTTGIVQIGVQIVERLEQGEEMDRLLLDTLKLANTASGQVPDRAIGKSKQRQESDNKTTILNLFQLGARNDGQQGRGSGSTVIAGGLSDVLQAHAADQDQEGDGSSV